MNLNTKLLLVIIAMLASGGVYIYVDNSKQEISKVATEETKETVNEEKPRTIVQPMETGKVGKYSGQTQPKKTIVRPVEKGKVGMF